MPTNKTLISLYLSPGTLDMVDELVEKQKKSRNKWITEAIDLSLQMQYGLRYFSKAKAAKMKK